MSRWFRLYDDALDDPKVQRLPPELFKAWVNMLCLASRSGGRLPETDDMAFALRVTSDITRDWVDALRERGLLDVDPDDGSLSPHNWNTRQFKSDADPTAAERQRRKRAKSKGDTPDNVTRDVTPTRDRTETDTEANPETSEIDQPLPVPATPKSGDTAVLLAFQKSEQPNQPEEAPKRKRNEYPPGFVRFWSDYPTDPIMSKVKAFKNWERLSRPEKEAAIGSLPGFNTYCRTHGDYRPVHAERYISEKRWEAAEESASRVAAVAGAYVRVGTDGWRAWEAHYRQLGKGSPLTDKAGKGWYFPSEFPPSSNHGTAA